jgi:hypothetical protein
MEVSTMPHKRITLQAQVNFAAAVTFALLFVFATTAGVDAADNRAGSVTLPSANGPRRLAVVESSPLIANGATLGTVVVYDDPMTPGREDYLEIYNRAGDLVAVAWFDRFGIQRIVIDRAFVDGKDQAEGVFVALVNGAFV